MAKGKSPSGLRSKKRRFGGNRYTSESKESSSASAKKLKLDINEQKPKADFIGYRIFDIEILFKEIESALSCKKCGNSVVMKEELQQGLSSKYSIHCEKCGLVSSFRNSKLLGVRSNIPEINRRSVYAMRTIGVGLAGLRTFCGIMDFPPPVSEKTCRPILTTIRNAVAISAELSMKESSKEEEQLTELQGGICVSGDGTWKTRGHSSLIGVCSVIGAETGKVIDVEILSSSCRGCQNWKGPKQGKKYQHWSAMHEAKCTKNHIGSAAKMEVVGMCNIFSRSETSRCVKYIQYIGDGDCKTYHEIQKLNPYGDNVPVEKIECINHVTKRMGTRLRKIKQGRKGEKLSDGKPLSGKGRLTDKLINSFSAYYGVAIRENRNALMDMRKSVWAIYYHSRSTDDEPLHQFCPKGPSSWCKFQKALHEDPNKKFVHMHSIPSAVMDELKPIFKDLSDPKLLKKCLAGRTQNVNESLNATIWKYCPKTSGCGRVIAETATYEAVISFNNGNAGRLKTMQELGLSPGVNAVRAAIQADKKRIINAEKKHLNVQKKLVKLKGVLQHLKQGKI